MTDNAAAHALAALKVAASPTHGPAALAQRVLVVEDHAFQRLALVRVIRSFGVPHVCEAADGAQALEILARHRGCIDAVVTDLDMPGVDGMALMRQIGTHAPDAGILVLSAGERDLLTAVEWLAREQLIHLVAVLEKPVSREALEAALRRPRLVRPRPPSVAAPAASLDDISAALAADQFEAFLQPKLRLIDGQMCGAEALARWRHPTLGWIAPTAFIEVIERSALIGDFSLAMLESVAWAIRWLADSGLPGRIALNASPAWLDQPDMAERLSQTMTRLGLPVERLTIEVTESVSSSNLTATLENLARLRMRGFLLSVDDFGTGFSSLQRLVSSPFSEIKLDRSFISGVLPDTPRWYVVESTIALANKLGLKTVAEGVETKIEHQMLRQAGCDCIQGYYVAKPMSRIDFCHWKDKFLLERDGQTGAYTPAPETLCAM